MTKLFNVVGVSRVREGAALKLRVANGKPERRMRILERNGHADVALFLVEPAVSKDDALVWLQANYAEIAALVTPRKTKVVKNTTETVAETATETVAETATEAVVETATEVVELTADQKLAAKRAKDAQRKREKRAAEKAAKLAA